MLKGAVAGTSPTSHWTDRRTGNRTPDHDEHQPWRIPLDRPCLLPKLALVKQVRTLPWHFTPKGTLYGPIYGIYVG